MQIEQFAEQHRLRTRRDECNDTIIPGRVGQIYDNGAGRRGVMYMPDPDGNRDPSPKRWNNRKRKLTAAGCQIKNDGDGEGIALFDPDNAVQVRLAIQVAGIKRIRMSAPPSPAQVASRLLFSRRARPGRPLPALNSIGKTGVGVAPRPSGSTAQV